MDIPFIKINWNKYETALLVNTYEDVASGKLSRKEAISTLSQRLRYGMIIKGMEISPKYRNENGISMQLSVMEFYMTQGKQGMKNHKVGSKN